MRQTSFLRHCAHRAARRSLLVALLFTVALCVLQLSGAGSAEAATRSVAQCNGNGPSPSGATTSMRCTVVVVNTINGAHRGSTTTLTRLCLLGPCAPGNGTFVSHSTSLVTSVSQCNGSDNDSAHPITCTVRITNNISAGTNKAQPVTKATVNQCVGSATGGGGTINCAPFPANTTGATVTQCNGSGTGGGGTVHCTVDSASVVSPAIPVKVNQCNGTGNPGGSVVTCSVLIRTLITPGASGSSAGSSAGSSSGSGGGSGSDSGSGSGSSSNAKAGGPAGSSTGITTGQVTRVPSGGVQTGGGSTSGPLDGLWVWLGGGVLIAGTTALALRARHSRTAA